MALVVVKAAWVALLDGVTLFLGIDISDVVDSLLGLAEKHVGVVILVLLSGLATDVGI